MAQWNPDFFPACGRQHPAADEELDGRNPVDAAPIEAHGDRQVIGELDLQVVAAAETQLWRREHPHRRLGASRAEVQGALARLDGDRREPLRRGAAGQQQAGQTRPQCRDQFASVQAGKISLAMRPIRTIFEVDCPVAALWPKAAGMGHFFAAKGGPHAISPRPRHRGRTNDAIQAGVAELVDALDLGSSDESCGGSSPSARTKRSRAFAR